MHLIRRRFTGWVTLSVIALAVVLLAILYLTPSRDRDVFTEWANTVDTRRLKLGERIARDKLVIGMSREEVLNKLGKPSDVNVEGTESYYYLLSRSLIDPYYLHVEVEGARVVKAAVISD
jgi:outer membrane protein assembly factor BamE (lipoprotein component of BamABCDE complex)